MPDDPSQVIVVIDFDDDGDFDDANEDVSSRWLSDAQIVCERGKDQVRLLSPPAAGHLSTELDNRSRDYSAENLGSPIAGDIEPGRKVQVAIDQVGQTIVISEEITTEAGIALTTEDGDVIVTEDQQQVIGTGSPLWTGVIDDLPEFPHYSKYSVGLPCLGNLSKLRGKRISTALYENITTDVALGHLLDAAGWPADERVLATGDATLLIWYADDVDAFDAAVQLLYTEGPGAAIYEDAFGRFVFENRNYRLTQPRSTIPQFTFRDTEYLMDLHYEARRKDVVNACTLRINTRQLQPAGVIWRLEEDLILAPNEVRKIVVRGEHPFINAQIPDPTAGINEVQIITISGSPSSGGISVSFEGATFTIIKSNITIGLFSTLTQINQILNSIPTIAGNVIATGGPTLASGPVFVEFVGTLGKTDVPLLEATSQLQGGTNPAVTVEEFIKGQPPDYVLLAGSVASMTFDRDSGAQITLTITAGASGAHISGLQVRAEAYEVTSEQEVRNAFDASASIAKYGEQPFELSVWPEISQSYAQQLADAVVFYHQNPRPIVWIDLIELDSTIFEQMIEREISDRITVIEAQTGLNTDVFIERIRHVIDNAAILHTQFGCEKSLIAGGSGGGGGGGGGNFGLWDVGQWDVSQWSL